MLESVMESSEFEDVPRRLSRLEMVEENKLQMVTKAMLEMWREVGVSTADTILLTRVKHTRELARFAGDIWRLLAPPDNERLVPQWQLFLTLSTLKAERRSSKNGSGCGRRWWQRWTTTECCRRLFGLTNRVTY